MTVPSRRRVLVIGGGIAGLSAAVELAGDADVELRERAARLGGKIATSPFAGVAHVDEGPDAFLRRVPAGLAFARRVGVGDDELTAPADVRAAIWHDGLHDIPAGVMLGVPAAIRPFVTTRLLSWRGKARAATEPFRPRSDPGDSIGALVRSRFGDEVHERLVDALVGSIYATDTDHASLAAVPQLAELASRHRSLLVGAMRARRRVVAPAGPVFAAPLAGLARLVDAAAEHLARHGARVLTGTRVERIERDGTEWRVDGDVFDAVVIATPAREAAQTLATAAPDVAATLRSVEAADVVLVRLAIAGDDWPAHLAGRSGYLVPKPDQRLVTAVSFGSQKWDHWRTPTGSQILRVSLGRDGLAVRDLDDAAIRDAVVTELERHLGFGPQPTEVSITRWFDGFPQYRPHHHEVVAAADRALPQGLALAGASYRGIGVPACIADGVRAARRVSS